MSPHFNMSLKKLKFSLYSFPIRVAGALIIVSGATFALPVFADGQQSATVSGTYLPDNTITFTLTDTSWLEPYTEVGSFGGNLVYTVFSDSNSYVVASSSPYCYGLEANTLCYPVSFGETTPDLVYNTVGALLGTYYINYVILDGSDDPVERKGWIEFTVSETGVVTVDTPPPSSSTSFITLSPLDGVTVATSTDLDVGADLYINPADYVAGMYLEINVRDSRSGLSTIPEFASETRKISIPSSGSHSLSYPFYVVDEGIRFVSYSVKVPSFFFFQSVLISTSSEWIASTTSAFDFFPELRMENAYNSHSLENCGLFSATTSGFNLSGCISDLFVPDSINLATIFDESLNGQDGNGGFLRYFPLGYVTDFVSILSTSTIATSFGIHAIIPAGIPGTGATLDLDLSSTTLGWLYESDIGTFTNSSAPDTRTFFEITYDYWKVIVYLAVLFYLIGRIIGKRIIPNLLRS